MPESLRDKIRREWCDIRVRSIKWTLKWLIHRLDELQYDTMYHIITERFYEKLHVYGTRVDCYEDGELR